MKLAVTGDAHVSELPTVDLPTAPDIPRDASTIDLLERLTRYCVAYCNGGSKLRKLQSAIFI